jgi:hypothetical protein
MEKVVTVATRWRKTSLSNERTKRSQLAPTGFLIEGDYLIQGWLTLFTERHTNYINHEIRLPISGLRTPPGTGLVADDRTPLGPIWGINAAVSAIIAGRTLHRSLPSISGCLGS